MFTKLTVKPIRILFVIMLLSALVVGSAVTAKQSSAADAPPEQWVEAGSPIPGGPGFISVSTFGFESYDSATIRTFANTWMHNGGTEYGAYFAPVFLPHKSNLTKVVFFYYDTDTIENMNFYLEQVNLFNGDRSEVARAYSSGSAGLGYVECEIFERSINNQLYSYVLEVDIPGGHGVNLSLVNTRIDYAYPSYLPTIQR